MIPGHGGCGATTFAAFLDEHASEATVELPFGSAPPVAAVLASVNGLGHSPLSVWRGRCVVVVVLGTAFGLKRAMEITSELLGHGVEVVVAVVADGVLAEPVPVRARIRTLRGVTRAVVRVPYVPRWRIEDEPVAAPPAYMAAVHSVRAALRLPDETGGSRRKEHNRAQ